jgi:hypothetical protein
MMVKNCRVVCRLLKVQVEDGIEDYRVFTLQMRDEYLCVTL